MSEKAQPLPKFGEWDVNDPASADGFTVIFNKARDEKKTGGKPESPSKADAVSKRVVDPMKPPAVRFFSNQAGTSLKLAGTGRGCMETAKKRRERKNGFVAFKALMQTLEKVDFVGIKQ